MNETWQEELAQDYNDGLLTREEVRNQIDDARSANGAIPPYVERDQGQEQAA